MIALQVIGIKEALAVDLGDMAPEQAGRGAVARPQGVGHNWACAPAKVSHSQTTSRRRRATNVHSSSSSRASPSVTGTRVCSKGGKVRAFFESGAHRVADYPEGPAQPAQAAPLLVGRKMVSRSAFV